jgi:hypothetical protein
MLSLTHSKQFLAMPSSKEYSVDKDLANALISGLSQLMYLDDSKKKFTLMTRSFEAELIEVSLKLF